MMTWRVALSAVAGSLALPLVAARGQTLEEVEKKINQHADQLKSWVWEGTTIQDFDSEHFKMKATMHGRIEFMKQDGKVLYHMETKSSGSRQVAGQEDTLDSTSTTICDGQFVYTLTEQGGEKSATKTKADPVQTSAFGKADFELLRQSHDLKLLADETLDGQGVYVVEAIQRAVEGAPMGPTRSLYYFSKDNGFNLKTVTMDANGKTILTATTKSLQMNPTLSPDRFVFKAPEGVEVMDLTQMHDPYGSGQDEP